ncbi:class I SAM-dependent methyltransferase [Hyalangium rubrum]|uniref:Uncharacterized protein n=1 Tax=Hyalangium rubrum TaxID=3103134 RepID=A0ABU5HAW8_9BACT|nr:methyltransferase domain-containing protein [Hyalangium sp. s54d21]MDY7230445.1 hypothetical protein [Hyalangium sp. s54d21]
MSVKSTIEHLARTVEDLGIPGLRVDQDTLSFDEPVALACIDCDRLESIQGDLERLVHRVSPGGMIFFADYNSLDSRRAFLDAWVVAHPEFRVLEAGESLVVQRRAREATQDHAALWADPASVQGRWTERAQLAADMVSPGSSVLDIGAGGMAVRRLLHPACRYTPSDFVQRSEDCIVADLNAGQFPPGRWDVVTMLGVLEYIQEPAAVLTRIGAAAPRLVMSYCCRKGASIAYRRKLTWVNDFTPDELDVLLRQTGWRMERAVELKRLPTFTEVLLSCTRDGASETA